MVLTLVVAVFFFGMGVVGLVDPGRITGQFGIQLDSAPARAEVRAVYGGFGVAMGFLLTAAAFDVGGIRVGAVIAVAVALLGMAFGRLISRFIERGEFVRSMWFYFWVELIGAGALLFTVSIS